MKERNEGILSHSGLRSTRNSLKSVRFKSSAASIISPVNGKKKIDLFPDEKHRMGTIEVIDDIIKQEMSAIAEEPVSKQEKTQMKISQFVDQYNVLNQQYKSILESKYSTINYNRKKQKQLKPIKVNPNQVKTLDAYLGSSTLNLSKIESKIVF